jgi:hypothetical protein
MPKNEIDYSKTIIYKIHCKDNSIKDVYIGHTTSFIKRKYQHKMCCNNMNNILHIYKVIREQGGWNNWEMSEIATYNCNNSEEARIKEREHYELHKLTLNTCPPYVNKEQYYCDICKLHCNSKSKYDKHIECKHLKNSFSPKNSKKYYCKNCEFGCSKDNEWYRHILTSKHKYAHNGTNMENSEMIKNSSFICDCKKEYKNASGLWKHKKKCCNKEELNEILTPQEDSKSEICDKELIIMLIKQNSELMKETYEFKNMMMEFIKNGTHNTTNSHNKTFNLQLFLNETCKDAMNIMDFVDSIKLQLSDLENVGKLGYVEGISNIITSNLNALDVTQRPIHCADKKREVMYVKDEDKWEKEDDQKKKIRKAIKRVASKNQRLIPQFKEKHPDCLKASSNFSDQYNKIVVESMGGSGDNDNEKEEKIIRNISKQVIIEK